MKKGTDVYDKQGKLMGRVSPSSIRRINPAMPPMHQQKVVLTKRHKQMGHALKIGMYDHLDGLTGKFFKELGEMHKIREERKGNGGGK